MASPHSQLASRFVQSAQWDRALATARDWLAEDPENARAHLTAGQALINLKRETEAASHLTATLRAEPENDFAHRLMSISHFASKRYQEADESAHKAISLRPLDAMHWYHLGHMAHSQGDLTTARRCAEKARELNPRHADIVNLLAICQPREDGSDRSREYTQYLEALELDPENAMVHNNLGVYHLNVKRDFQAAEECFRRALSIQPTRAMFRTNLLVTLKHRDTVYRVLCAPRDFLAWLASLGRRRKVGPLLMVLLWVLLGRYFLAALLLWLVFVWPLLKIYERLTVSDVRARAGELGARKGGFLGYRAWPVQVKLLIAALVLAAFWAVIITIAPRVSSENWGRFALGILALVLVYFMRRRFLVWRNRVHTRRRARRVGDLLNPGMKNSQIRPSVRSAPLQPPPLRPPPLP